MKMSDSSPKCVFLFDMTRHRSHLFFRFLSTHPDIQSHWHPYLPAFLFGPERITQHTKKADASAKKAEVEWDGTLSTETYSDADDKFLRAFEQAQNEGKIFVANEHCQMVQKQDVDLAIIRKQTSIPIHSNPTVIPDAVFEALTPIFVIRHPVFAVPSNYTGFQKASEIRPGDEDWNLITSLQIQRHLFDFFREREGRPPLVVDGDDVVWNTTETGKKVCEALGLDPSGISDKWEAVPEAQRSNDPLLRHFLQVSDDSTGIVRTMDVPPDTNLKTAWEKWREAYGNDVAKLLKERVEENMRHYEYMKQFTL